MMEDVNTDTQTEINDAGEVEFLLSGDEVAESFIGLVAQSDPKLIRTVFSNTALLFLANAKGNSDDLGEDELREVLVDSANQAFDLIVQELESIRDAKIAFAQGNMGFRN